MRNPRGSLKKILTIAALLVFAGTAPGLLAQQKFYEIKTSLVPSVKDGVYRSREKAVWTFTVSSNNVPLAGRPFSWVLKMNGLTEIKGEGTLTAKGAQITGIRTNAGSIYLEVQLPYRNGVVKAESGAIYDPLTIEPSLPEPADFQSFWDGQIAKLAKIPAKPALKPVKSWTDGVEYFEVTLNNINGSKVRGYLAKPVGPGPFPAMLVVQWAGVYKIDPYWQTVYAKQGWMVLNISAHDMKFGEKKEYYQALESGPLKNYTSIGSADREKSYFLRMYLSCYRAADYLCSRKDWNGRTLVVRGTSQGGGQSLVLAGLHPKVTGCAAQVPAMCDQTAKLVERLPSWPMLVWGPGPVAETSRYFDAVNFSRRIKADLLIGMGLADTVCPSHTVFAAYNVATCPKAIVVSPGRSHGGGDASEAAAKEEAFLETQRTR
jgi:cephalosporin-C deacetylase-like acetyl esterase